MIVARNRHLEWHFLQLHLVEWAFDPVFSVLIASEDYDLDVVSDL